MVDNFQIILPLLKFPHKDSFYFVQILQRKKDHKGTALGGSNNSSRLIKAYYITSKEKLEIHKEEMIKLAEVFQSRVSINLNPRSFEKAAFALLRKVADQMSNKDFYNVRKAYDSICGEYHAEMDKRWIVDVDEPDNKTANFIANSIQQLQMESYKPDKDTDGTGPRRVLAVLPSKSGWHIISEPFNLEAFNKRFPGIEVHKNNPTNLFIP